MPKPDIAKYIDLQGSEIPADADKKKLITQLFPIVRKTIARPPFEEQGVYDQELEKLHINYGRDNPPFGNQPVVNFETHWDALQALRKRAADLIKSVRDNA
jgi:hypothetical protein